MIIFLLSDIFIYTTHTRYYLDLRRSSNNLYYLSIQSCRFITKFLLNIAILHGRKYKYVQWYLHFDFEKYKFSNVNIWNDNSQHFIVKKPRQIDNLKFVLNWCFYVRFTEIMQNPLNNLSQSSWLNENVKTTVISSYNCISDVIKKTCRKIGMVREGISKIKNLQFFFSIFFFNFLFRVNDREI